jgi:hypothetical protein
MRNILHIVRITIFITILQFSSCTKDEKVDQLKLSTAISPSKAGTVSPTGGTYESGEDVTIKATASEGYRFKNWDSDPEQNINPITFKINKDRRIIAYFEKLDSDGDGVSDDLDQCQETPIGRDVDENGCSDSQIDSDGDGVFDDLDRCPETASGEIVDAYGCVESNPISYDVKPSDYELLSNVNGLVIRNMSDQVQAALNSCGEGGTVWLEDKIWSIDKNLEPKFSNTHLTGGTLKRANSVHSVLIQDANIGDTTLYIENSEQFYPGLTITISDGLDFGNTMYPQIYIKAINPGEIVLWSPINKAFQSGATVFSVVSLFQINHNTVNNTMISNIVFDGNEQNNNHTYDWRLNRALVLGGITQIVENCLFINSPCESIIGHNSIIRNCKGENLFGSFIHCSAYENGNILIEDCSTLGTNKATQQRSGHSEGTITFSDNSGDLTIINSIFNMGTEAAWGLIGPDDCKIIALNTTFIDHQKKYFNTPPELACFDDTTVIYINTPD